MKSHTHIELNLHTQILCRNRLFRSHAKTVHTNLFQNLRSNLRRPDTSLNGLA